MFLRLRRYGKMAWKIPPISLFAPDYFSKVATAQLRGLCQQPSALERPTYQLRRGLLLRIETSKRTCEPASSLSFESAEAGRKSSNWYVPSLFNWPAAWAPSG